MHMSEAARLDAAMSTDVSNCTTDIQKYFAAVHAFGAALAVIRHLEASNKILTKQRDQARQTFDEIADHAAKALENVNEEVA